MPQRFTERNPWMLHIFSFSPLSPSITNDLTVSIATSFHQRLPFSNLVHHLSSPYSDHFQDHRTSLRWESAFAPFTESNERQTQHPPTHPPPPLSPPPPLPTHTHTTHTITNTDTQSQAQTQSKTQTHTHTTHTQTDTHTQTHMYMYMYMPMYMSLYKYMYLYLYMHM